MVLRICLMIATSGFLTAIECIKLIFGLGCASDPTGGAYNTSPDPLAGLSLALLLRGKGGEGSGGGRVEGERMETGGTAPMSKSK